MKKEVKNYSLKDLPTKLVAEEGKHVVYYFNHAGSIKKDTIELVLDKPNAELELCGAISASGEDHIEISTITRHIVGENNSRIKIKTVLDDKSRFDFTGMIEIAKDAQKSDAYLQQDNLVVSDEVICNTSPQLEIQADDVKASHGATVGTFEIDQLFYLTSRGLSLKQAKKLISEGFLNSVYP